MTVDKFFAAVWSLLTFVVFVYSFISSFTAAFAHEWGEASFWMLFIIALNTMKMEKI